LTFTGLTFTGLTFTGLTFTGLTFTGLTFTGLTFTGLTFAGLTFAGLTFAGLTFAGLTFAGLHRIRVLRTVLFQTLLDLAFDRSIGPIDFLDRSTQGLLFGSQNALGGVLNTLPEALELFGNLTGFLDCWLLHPPLDHHRDPIKALLGRQTTRIPIGLVQLLGQERLAPFGLFDRILDAIQQIEVLLFLFLPILKVSFWQVFLLIQFRIAAKQRLASWAAGLWLIACWLIGCWLTAIRPVGSGLWVPRRQIRLFPQLAFQFGLIFCDILSLLDQLLDVPL
jgi:hypothetical protein